MYKYKIVTNDHGKHDIIFTNDIECVQEITKNLYIEYNIKSSVFELVNGRYSKLVQREIELDFVDTFEWYSNLTEEEQQIIYDAVPEHLKKEKEQIYFG